MNALLARFTVERETLSSQLAAAVDDGKTLTKRIDEFAAESAVLSESLEAAAQPEANEAASVIRREAEVAEERASNPETADTIGRELDARDAAHPKTQRPAG